MASSNSKSDVVSSKGCAQRRRGRTSVHLSHLSCNPCICRRAGGRHVNTMNHTRHRHHSHHHQQGEQGKCCFRGAWSVMVSEGMLQGRLVSSGWSMGHWTEKNVDISDLVRVSAFRKICAVQVRGHHVFLLSPSNNEIDYQRPYHDHRKHSFH